MDDRSWVDRLEERHDEMVATLLDWSAINSGSRNMAGLDRMWSALAEAFGVLNGDIERLPVAPARDFAPDGASIDIPHGDALRLVKRPQAPVRVLLAGHMDTVFPEDHPFQKPVYLDDDTINGPGVADMKGGLLVMLHALRVLEETPYAERIGYEVLINADEEVSSLGSAPLLRDAAERAQFALVYEPALADGTLAGARKGSANFVARIEGRAAHAGREHHLGRNALVAAARFVTAIDALNGRQDGLTVNPARIEGGGPNNIVPDMALARFNIRVADADQQRWTETQLQEIAAEIEAIDGISIELAGGFHRAPKPMTPAATALFEAVKAAGSELGLEIAWKPTGGCCDGNNLAAAGLPVVDTLGVRGGEIHSSREFMTLSSLVERAQLSALLLIKAAKGEAGFGETIRRES